MLPGYRAGIAPLKTAKPPIKDPLRRLLRPIAASGA
jgi:hypothetical protein